MQFKNNLTNLLVRYKFSKYSEFSKYPNAMRIIRMSSKIALTTGDIAAHCLISADTVINWIKEKKLKAYTTPGGHRRIHVSDLKVFLNEYNLPPYPEDVLETRKVLVVDDEPKVVELITNCLGMTDQYELATAADGFDAGLQVSKFNPNLIILDLMMPNIDGFNSTLAL